MATAARFEDLKVWQAARRLDFGRISVSEMSRSDHMMVAVAFRPRMRTNWALRRGATLDGDTLLHASLSDAMRDIAMPRALKPTATVIASLCEAPPPQT